MKRRVLFVCLGNICRSPTAEGVLRHVVAERGLEDEVEVDSAGTGAWHLGEQADGRMRAAAAERGYELTSVARQVEPEDLDRFDLVVAMDRVNLQDLEEIAGGPRDNLRLFSDFVEDGPPDVPDPYYGGPKGFDMVLDLVEAGCSRLLDELLAD